MFSHHRSLQAVVAAVALLAPIGCGTSPTTPVPEPVGADPEPAATAPVVVVRPAATAGPVTTADPARTAGPVATARPTPAASAAPAAKPTTAAPAAVARTLGAASTELDLPAGGEAIVALVAGDEPVNARLAAGGASGYGLAAAEPAAARTSSPEAARRAHDRRFDGLTRKFGYGLKAMPEAAVGARDDFWVIANEEGGELDERQVSARCISVGQHAQVWVDERVAGLVDERAVAMGAAFDQRIWPTNVRIFGAPIPGDRDPRVTILVSPEVDDHGNNGTIGYFSARDLFSLQDAPDMAELARSNDRLIIFVSANVVARGRDADLYGTLAHEFQHLQSATRKLFGPNPAGRQEDLWLNEALSMYAMEANGYGLAGGARIISTHVAGYLARPEAYPLVDWDAAPEGSAYGPAYLFALYLAQRAGEGVMAELVDSRETGVANVAAQVAARGLTFDGVFRDWAAATLLDGTSRPADPQHAYAAIDLRGTYAGLRLRGPAVTTLEPPFAVRTAMLPWTARYLRVASDAGGSWDLGLGGAPFGWLWTPASR